MEDALVSHASPVEAISPVGYKITGEEQTAGSLDQRGVYFKLRAKINDNSLA